MDMYMKFFTAHKIDDDTVYYNCSCGEIHAKDNDFDFYSNRSIFRSSECSDGDVCIHITENTRRVLPPKLMRVYEKRQKEDNYYKNLSRMMRRMKMRNGRRYLGMLGK